MNNLRIVLEKYESKNILCVTVHNIQKIEKLRDTFFPYAGLMLINSKVQPLDVEKLSTKLESNLWIFDQFERFSEFDEIHFLFPVDLIILFTDSQNFSSLEKKVSYLWRMIYRHEDDGIIIFEKKFKSLNLVDLTDDLKRYVTTGKIELLKHGFYLMRYYHLEPLQKLWDGINIERILAITAENGETEKTITKLLFPKANLYLAEENPRDAVLKYFYCDLMLIILPKCNKYVYKNVIKHFKGKYIVFIYHNKLASKDIISSQLEKWGTSVLKIRLESYICETELLIVHRDTIEHPLRYYERPLSIFQTLDEDDIGREIKFTLEPFQSSVWEILSIDGDDKTFVHFRNFILNIFHPHIPLNEASSRVFDAAISNYSSNDLLIFHNPKYVDHFRNIKRLFNGLIIVAIGTVDNVNNLEFELRGFWKTIFESYVKISKSLIKISILKKMYFAPQIDDRISKNFFRRM